MTRPGQLGRPWQLWVAKGGGRVAPAHGSVLCGETLECPRGEYGFTVNRPHSPTQGPMWPGPHLQEVTMSEEGRKGGRKASH